MKRRAVSVSAKKRTRSAPRAAKPAASVTAAPAPKEEACAVIPTEVHAFNAYVERCGLPAAHALPQAPAPQPRKARSVASMLMVALAAVIFGSAIIRAVDAASFVGPTQAPPNGNIPITVWNREAAGAQQTSASIDIDGGSVAATGKGISVGKSTFDLGSAAGGQNIFYGVASYAGMHAGDSLLKLQTFAGAAYTDRLNLSKDGNLKVAGCLGKTFAGMTTLTFTPGAVGSYYGADNKCGVDFPGSHVCRAEEILESIACSVAGDPIRNAAFNNVSAWVHGGPPGYKAQSNDCHGWTATDANSYGRFWTFDATTGGRGGVTGCNVAPAGALKFACCR